MPVKTKLTLAAAIATLTLGGCSKRAHESRGVAEGQASAPIVIDGSSTVFPISEAMAEEFQKKHRTQVTVAASGTGGGFKKLCAKEVAIAGASRPIKPSEVDACKANGVSYIELPVAYDGIAVVVHRDNDWVDSMTVAELKKLWEPAARGRVTKWSDVRRGWPDQEIHLFGAGVDSGTYDYFTAAVVGKEHASRGDYTSSEDDNVLVKGISTDKLALGFFGFAYYAENRDALKLVAIDDEKPDNGAGPIAPSQETIERGTYQPLSRPVFIYVRSDAAEREEVQTFVEFYLGEGVKLVNEVGYIALPASTYKLAAERFKARTTGSLFEGAGSKVGVTVADLLQGK
jgi:phosphate transport system substrate-binding protein